MYYWSETRESNPALCAPNAADDPASSSPILSGWRGRNRTCNTRHQKPLLYQLSYSPSNLPIGAPECRLWIQSTEVATPRTDPTPLIAGVSRTFQLFYMVPLRGLEPPTLGLSDRYVYHCVTAADQPADRVIKFRRTFFGLKYLRMTVSAIPTSTVLQEKISI
jgi:hypothetical protein